MAEDTKVYLLIGFVALLIVILIIFLNDPFGRQSYVKGKLDYVIVNGSVFRRSVDSEWFVNEDAPRKSAESK